MLSIGALSFTVPWLLLALAALPALWWLLRAVPPAPSQVAFPAIRLLFGLPQHEETPHRTPWWLLALRLLLAALVILALAHPVLDPGRVLRTSGPLVLVIDNDWSAGDAWTERQEAAAALIDEAGEGAGEAPTGVASQLRPVRGQRGAGGEHRPGAAAAHGRDTVAPVFFVSPP